MNKTGVCNLAFILCEFQIELPIFPPFQMSDINKRYRKKGPLDFRAMLDFFMGALMIFFGAFIGFSAKFLGYDYFEGTWLASGALKWIMAGLFAFYGLFRAYRGYLQWKDGKEIDE
jgi:hypothetical protein